MKLVVGLGNPGEKYKNSRHNVGFLVVDKLAGDKAPWRLEKSKEALVSGWGREVKLVKPQSFMNKSGLVVKKLLPIYRVKRKEQLFPPCLLWVVYDDLDIGLGSYKISFGKGPRNHRGINSIYEQLGTKEFWQVRVGIDNRMNLAFAGSGEEYVLSKWRPRERKLINETITRIVSELKNRLIRE